MKPLEPSAAPSPSTFVLGPAPWKKFERDPNRPIDDDDHEEAHSHAAMAEAMHKLQVEDEGWRFHGKASGARLVHVISELKYKPGQPTLFDALRKTKRPEYWTVPEWEMVIAKDDICPVDWSIWPSQPLDQQLIDSYFHNVNFHLPLLNRIMFQRQYQSGLHHTNHDFAKVCLMIFANGSRFIDNEEVYWPVTLATTPEGQERLRRDQDGTRKYSAGWKYVRACMKMGKSIMQAPGLYEFQVIVLSCAFLQGSAVPHLMWLVSGVGLRSAQELGIHIRSTLVHVDPIERALCNRAFWCLYHIDRVNCAAIGRSVALQDSDFDADYPIAVDDEYWELGFKQPDGILPQISAFIHLLKLDHVIGAALRTIYAIPHEKTDRNAQRAIVVELDSALNAWADDVPDKLRWDPTRADDQLFQQSAVLYAHYYYCQILVHRPFIPTPRQKENIGLPSLAICSNASRSIANILDAVIRRGRQRGHLPGRIMDIAFMLPAMIAAIILLISVHAGNQQAQEKERAMQDVQKCLAAVREVELTWRQAGKLADFLNELAREGPLPTEEPSRGEKRNIDSIWQPSQDAEQTLFSPGLDFTFGDEQDLWTQLFGSFV
jgi:hypothetical protein